MTVSFNSILKKHLKDFERRPEQEAMARAVTSSLNHKRHLIVEAGTGVGKSLAYLIPLSEFVLKDKTQAVVSTYTKALQRQLIEKDLPFLKENLFPDLCFTAAFGGENYLCLRRLSQSKKHGLFDIEESHELNELNEWASLTGKGIRHEISLSNSLWQKVAREADLCHGKDCKSFKKCFYQKAKAGQRQSHIIVTNHHLYFANVASGMRLLPQFDIAVFDEAHVLEDVAADYLGIEVSNMKFLHLMDSVLSAQGYGLISRLKWLLPSQFSSAASILEGLRQDVHEFFRRASDSLEGSMTMRIRKLGLLPDTLSEPLRRLEDELASLHTLSKDEDEKKDITALMARCRAHSVSLRNILMQEMKDHVYWIEKEGRRLKLLGTPLNLAELLKASVFDNLGSSILTSATLSTGGNFDYIKERLGLTDVDEILLESPFDYKNHALLYIAKDMASPKKQGFDEELIDRIREILKITMGRTLVLFTNYRLIEKAEEAVNIEGLRILKQGDKDSFSLCEEFKADPSSVIFGTYTFWQGIDIPGDALQCVIITKLPFSVPDEPVIEARMEALKSEGKNPFSHYQVPQAAILLKQGFGRLIRTKKDMGVVAILDSRLIRQSYGIHFLKSLPQCKITTLLPDVKDFMNSKGEAL